MAIDVKLPELGEGVTEGELVKWLVKVGDSIKADQTVAEVMTDKATVEVPSPTAGTVKELRAKVGDTIKVEGTLLSLEPGAATASAATATAAPAKALAATSPSNSTGKAPATPAPQASAPAPTQMAAKAPAGASAHYGNGNASSSAIQPPVADFRVLATPATRRLAREMNVDLNSMQGTGLAGRVTREDVMSTQGGGMDTVPSAQFPTPTPRPTFQGNGALEERVPMAGIRKKIAENMQMAKHIIPHFTLMDEVEVTELVQMRESLKETAEKYGTKITYLPFVMKALLSTCRQFPMFNASIDDNSKEIVYKKYFNLGFAADTPNGLMVPVIKNADQKSLLELSQEIGDLSKRAREGKLKLDEMKGATITITNIGSVGGTYATPIINHPEVAILGMYKITDQLYMKPDHTVATRKVMNFTITADHRLIDGAVAANFLKLFLSKISKPGQLMLDLR